MAFKVIAGAIGAILLIGYMAPVVLKLRDEFSLWVVTMIGVVMMLVDLWQSLRSKED